MHEIKHDGYRLMARRNPIGIRLLTRNGHDWSPRYPLIVEAVNRLKARSRLIDGEAFACDNEGLPIFQKSCGADAMSAMFSCTRFDLLEVNGIDLRREPLEVRKNALLRLLDKHRFSLRARDPPHSDSVMRATAVGRLNEIFLGDSHNRHTVKPHLPLRQCTRVSGSPAGLSIGGRYLCASHGWRYDFAHESLPQGPHRITKPDLGTHTKENEGDCP